MKKILYLSDNDINTIGGSQKSIKTLIENINDKYFVYLLMPNNSSLKYDKCEVIYYKKFIKNWYKYMFLYKIRVIYKTIRKIKPDIVHAQNPEVGILLGLLRKFHFINKKTKCIYTDRGYLNGYYSKKYMFVFKMIANNFDEIITTTNLNKIEWNKISKKRVTCISNVLDNDWNEFDLAKKEDIKLKEGILNKINIGFCGRFTQYKRWDMVDKICNQLSEIDNINYIIAISCDTKEEENNMNKYIEYMKNKYKNKIKFFVGLNTEEMKNFYYMLDVFILTSENESFGRTLIEAMTKGNIVFGTLSGGVPDVIKNNDFLYNVEDADELLLKIKKQLKNKKQALEYFNKLYNNEYTIEKLISKHIKIY